MTKQTKGGVRAALLIWLLGGGLGLALLGFFAC
jgi:hypothetical protein